MDLNLKGKTVVITGGATGIGKAAAREFLREGANVAVFARRKEKVEAFIAEMSEEFDRAQLYGETADATNYEQVSQFAKNVHEHFKSLDVWMNNAGVKIDKFFDDFTQEEWEYIMKVDVEGVWNGARAAAAYMKPQKSGVIINVSSFASKIPHAGQGLYAAAKSAVSSLTKSMAGELAPYGVRVVGIVPGMIQTDIATDIAQFYDKYVNDIALRRLGQPEDLAKPIVFLSSDAASYITGTDIEISGGKFCIQNTPHSWAVMKEKEA